MTYFNNINTLEDLKKEYRKLAKKFHPDLNKHDTTKDMQQINAEYETLFNELKNSSKSDNESKETSSSFINIINELIKYENINIDIVGSWLWISGNTYAIKDQLKKIGFRWSKGKKKWYYADTLSNKKKKGTLSYNQIVSKYGKQTITSNNTMKYIS